MPHQGPEDAADESVAPEVVRQLQPLLQHLLLLLQPLLQHCAAAQLAAAQLLLPQPALSQLLLLLLPLPPTQHGTRLLPLTAWASW